MKPNLPAKAFSIFIAIILFSCKGRVFKVPSSSMLATLKIGQTIYVKKTSTFQRDDIAVINYYGNNYMSAPDENGHFKQHWEKRVYRIIAVSGDELQIKDGNVFLNKKEIPLPPDARMPYRIYTKEVIEEIISEEEYVDFKQSGDTIIYSVNLSQAEAKKYEERKPAVIRVKRQVPDINYITDTAYAKTSSNDQWNSSNYGPLKIPVPGEKIIVTDDNFKLYHNIPGIKKGENIITETLYFVMGDNRYYAEDSRFIGFISYSNMYGIVK